MPVPAYCTNVHAGATLPSMRAALAEHAVAVRRNLVQSDDLEPSEPLPIGAWLAAPVAFELLQDSARHLGDLKDWLAAHQLAISTINGFPFADFHLPQVKHAVYAPNWTTAERRDYTTALIECAAVLSPDGAAGTGRFSISTLPLGWPTGDFASAHPASALEQSARHLLDVVEHARRVADRSGQRIRVDLEPEPGCVLQRASDVAVFADRHLWPEARRRGMAEEIVRQHLGVCLDVCHLAVMFEEAADFVGTIHGAGLNIGKVQVSSAPRCDFSDPGATGTLGLLRQLAEDRYLHQTMVRLPDGSLRFSEDLPAALAWIDAGRPAEGEWRVHYHVPIFLERLGGEPSGPSLLTTQHLIEPALAATALDQPTIEVETYAWSVLPNSLRPASLSEGIADELRWAKQLVECRTPGVSGGRSA